MYDSHFTMEALLPFFFWIAVFGSSRSFKFIEIRAVMVN